MRVHEEYTLRHTRGSPRGEWFGRLLLEKLVGDWKRDGFYVSRFQNGPVASSSADERDLKVAAAEFARRLA